MSGFDKRGPYGQGPMTGAGRGFCLIKQQQEDVSLKGRGFGCFMGGRSLRRGRRSGFFGERNMQDDISVSFDELQDKFDQLQSDFAILKSKTQ